MYSQPRPSGSVRIKVRSSQIDATSPATTTTTTRVDGMITWGAIEVSAAGDMGAFDFIPPLTDDAAGNRQKLRSIASTATAVLASGQKDQRPAIMMPVDDPVDEVQPSSPSEEDVFRLSDVVCEVIRTNSGERSSNIITFGMTVETLAAANPNLSAAIALAPPQDQQIPRVTHVVMPDGSAATLRVLGAASYARKMRGSRDVAQGSFLAKDTFVISFNKPVPARPQAPRAIEPPTLPAIEPRRDEPTEDVVMEEGSRPEVVQRNEIPLAFAREHPDLVVLTPEQKSELEGYFSDVLSIGLAGDDAAERYRNMGGNPEMFPFAVLIETDDVHRRLQCLQGLAAYHDSEHLIREIRRCNAALRHVSSDR